MQIILGLFMFVFGFVHYKFPYQMWWLEMGWKVKSGEPADWYLELNKYAGIFLMIPGVMLIVYGLFLL